MDKSDEMDLDATEIRCRNCKSNLTIADITLETFDPEDNSTVYLFHCPICETHTTITELEDE